MSNSTHPQAGSTYRSGAASLTPLADSIARAVESFEQAVAKFATQDVPAVAGKVRTGIEQEMAERPIESILTAIALGFSLAGLSSKRLRGGALQILKIIALRTLSTAAEHWQEMGPTSTQFSAKSVTRSTPQSNINPGDNHESQSA